MLHYSKYLTKEQTYQIWSKLPRNFETTQKLKNNCGIQEYISIFTSWIFKLKSGHALTSKVLYITYIYYIKGQYQEKKEYVEFIVAIYEALCI